MPSCSNHSIQYKTIFFNVFHIQLLRSSLVNNQTQAVICDDLGMTEYVINTDQKVKERMESERNKTYKDKADILEGESKQNTI